jgi:hypothetical protein
LSGDEIVEIRIGKHAAFALPAVAGADVAQRAGVDMAAQRPDRAAQPGSGLPLCSKFYRHD